MSSSLFFGNYDYQTDNLDIIPLGKIFKNFFRFKENRVLFESLPSVKSQDEIEKLYDQQDWLDQNVDMVDVIKKGLQPISPDFLFQNSLIKITKAQTLEYSDYINTYHALGAGVFFSKKLNAPYISFNEGQKVQKFFKYFLKECELLFDFKSNSLITYKHPRLREIDKKISDLQKDIRSKLGQISTRWSGDELLQQNNYDVFDDKFVLPVRSDRFNSGLGRIIHRSKGGGVLYVEPYPLKELSNKLEECKAELEREIFKLLRSLSEELLKNCSEVKSIFHNLLAIDHLLGRYTCANAIELNKPQFNNDKTFDLTSLFHPLIEEPVKNDLLIKNKGMLISGPNTGGKTVLLKSLCLSLILPHYGLFVPAKAPNIFLTDEIHFMSHDNQSLEDGLSSFSSEAMMYLKSMDNLSPKAVVFIDEIFNTTSSYEASLLACALIRFINNAGATTFISSHHESLKEKVFQEKLLESAHMGFKKGSSQPTYVLHQGSPGRSFAREVFIRIEQQLRGDQLISSWLTENKISEHDIDQAIQSVDEIKDQVRQQMEKNKLVEEELKREKRKLESLLTMERQKLQDEFDERWKHLKKQTLDLTEKIKRGEVKNIIKVTDSLNKISQGPSPKNVPKTNPLKGLPQAGDRVTLARLGVKGTVLKTKGEKAYVESGKMKSWVHFKELLKVDDGFQKEKKERVRVNVLKENTKRSMKLDARGMRREEFLQEAEFHILDVINGDLPFVDIIHGHGDGILKKSLNNLLKKHQEDIKADHIEGNMGTTRVELKTT